MLNNLSEILKEGTTNFKVICHEWNKNNPNNTVDINATLPNYNNLHQKNTFYVQKSIETLIIPILFSEMPNFHRVNHKNVIILKLEMEI